MQSGTMLCFRIHLFTITEMFAFDDGIGALVSKNQFLWYSNNISYYICSIVSCDSKFRDFMDIFFCEFNYPQMGRINVIMSTYIERPFHNSIVEYSRHTEQFLNCLSDSMEGPGL